MSSNKLPVPGTEEAIAAGCECPIMDNEHGRGYMGMPGMYVYSSHCKIHDWGSQDARDPEKDKP